jgi:Putative bacterial sensory transduction regulator
MSSIYILLETMVHAWIAMLVHALPATMKRALAATLIATTFTFPAQATLLADAGVSASEFATALRQAGYPADVTADRSGQPLIRSSTGKVLFNVYFYQCSQQLRCESLQLTAPFRQKSYTQTAIGAWNRERRFGRAFLDNHGVAWLSMDIEASHGMTTEALQANVGRWIGVMNTFETFAAK